MRRIYYIALLLGVLVSLNSHAQNAMSNSPIKRLDKIVAIVEREAITQSELEGEMEKIKKQLEHFNQPIPSQAELRKQVLDVLIAKNLQLQIAKQQNIQVPEEDVNAAIESVAKNNKISVSQLKEAVERTGITYDEYHKQIREQIILQKVEQQELGKKVTLTPEDVKKFARENKAKFNQFSALHVVDILLPVDEKAGSAEKERAKKQATEIAKQLQSNKEKEVEAITSEFVNAEINDLGWRSLTEIPSLFQAKVAVMQVNGISPPLQAPNGFHILKLVEVKGQTIQPTETQLQNLAFQEKMAEAVKEWIKTLRNEAYVKIMN
jgi:peptidyl-prolyl cis-trans isomerase SurA